MPVSSNFYFDLTRELNTDRCIVLLASGQAVVYYRLALMSKDGDWILEETPAACLRVLEVLGRHGARYRSGAPLDVRWLAGGWSSHFELLDEQRRRIRCDFFTRPPRIPQTWLKTAFSSFAAGDLAVIDLPSLILMKKTQRAKDYPVIGELAKRLPPELEIDETTDPDRILELAPVFGSTSSRPAVRKALEGSGRLAVVLALAEEIDQLQNLDRSRVQRYDAAAEPYRRALLGFETSGATLEESHQEFCRLAEDLLPRRPLEEI
jgi:hypothetical protein